MIDNINSKLGIMPAVVALSQNTTSPAKTDNSKQQHRMSSAKADHMTKKSKNKALESNGSQNKNTSNKRDN